MAARAISGTRRAFKELVDGTLRVQIDVDPDCRRDFLRLFPDIDTRIALAPLKAATPGDDRPKGGELARLAGILCGDNEFRMWLQSVAPREALALGLKAPADDLAERAAVVMRAMCGVQSRAELDHNPTAAETFHRLIRKPWQDFKGR